MTGGLGMPQRKLDHIVFYQLSSKKEQTIARFGFSFSRRLMPYIRLQRGNIQTAIIGVIM